MDAGREIESAVDTVMLDLQNRSRDIGGNIKIDPFGHLVAKTIAGVLDPA